jgi:hypothetical protein
MATNEYVDPFKIFQGGIPFEGDIDVDWFCDIPNAHVARKRLEWLSSPSIIAELGRRGYHGAPLNRMWKAVYRACLSFDEPIPSTRRGHAETLGVRIG